MEFEKGCIVVSTAGRDKGKCLLVTNICQTHIEVCDGRERPLGRPKRKNPRHLKHTGMTLPGEWPVSDKALKKALAQISMSATAKAWED